MTTKMIAAACSAFASALALAGCETTEGAAPATRSVLPSSAAGQKAPPANNGEALQFTSIGPSALPAESCGMILWTLEGDRPSAIMRYVVGETAQVGLNGAVLDFPLGESSGVSRYGVSEWLAFINERGMRMDVRVNFGLGFDGGVYLEKGLITIEDAAGWRSVAPAAGIAGCR